MTTPIFGADTTCCAWEPISISPVRLSPACIRPARKRASSLRGRAGAELRRTPGNIQLLERLGTLVPTEVVALPIMQGEQAIGILYGDNAEHRVPIDSTAGLEIFLSQAGYALGKAIAAAERSDRG